MVASLHVQQILVCPVLMRNSCMEEHLSVMSISAKYLMMLLMVDLIGQYKVLICLVDYY